MSRRKPYQRPRKPPPMRLTERDKEILQAINAFDGMMSLKQIDRLFFSGQGRSQPRQRMRTLFANRYVQIPSERTIHRVPLGETIYWLDRRGAEVVAARQGITLGELSWRRKPRWSWIEHDLAVNDFRLQIHQACTESKQVELQPWVPETDFLANPDTVRFTDENDVSHTRQVRPDGFFYVTREREDREKQEGFAFMLEIDMATHSNPSFERNKVRAGLAYLKSEDYERRFGLRFGRWLVVTTTEIRMEHLLTQTKRAGGKGLFYFTTFDVLDRVAKRSQTGILHEPVWQVAGSRSLTPLIPDATVEAG
jgi:hypothetical protein